MIRRARIGGSRRRVSQDDIDLVRRSGYFDEDAYAELVSDRVFVGNDPIVDYLARGSREGLSPSARFDASWYLATNPDVAESGLDPLIHFLRFGQREGRAASPRAARAHEPRPAEGVLPSSGTPMYLRSRSVERSLEDDRALSSLLLECFSARWYAQQAGLPFTSAEELLDHYLTIGWKVGLNPSPDFDTTSYLASDSKLRSMGVEPLTHFVLLGRAEGRTPTAASRSRAQSAIAIQSRYADSWLEGLDPSLGRVAVVRWLARDGRPTATRRHWSGGDREIVIWELAGGSEWLLEQVRAMLLDPTVDYAFFVHSGVSITSTAAGRLSAAVQDALAASPVLLDGERKVASAGYRLMRDGGLRAVGSGWDLDHDLLGVPFLTDAADARCCIVRADVFAALSADAGILTSLQTWLAGAVLAASAGSERTVVDPVTTADLGAGPSDATGDPARERLLRVWFQREWRQHRNAVLNSPRPGEDVLSGNQRRLVVDWPLVPWKDGDIHEVIADRLADVLLAELDWPIAFRCLEAGAARDCRVMELEEGGIGVWRRPAEVADDQGRIQTIVVSWAAVQERSDERPAPGTVLTMSVPALTGTSHGDFLAIEDVVAWMPPVDEGVPVAEEVPSATRVLAACDLCFPTSVTSMRSAMSVASGAGGVSAIFWSRRTAMSVVPTHLVTDMPSYFRPRDLPRCAELIIWDTSCPSCRCVQFEATSRGVTVVDVEGGRVQQDATSTTLLRLVESVLKAASTIGNLADGGM